MDRRSFLGTAVAATLAGSMLRADTMRSRSAWYKGNLHAHTYWSDGRHFPEMAAVWYKDHGYHFLSITDHNLLIDPPLSNVVWGSDKGWFELDGGDAWKTAGRHDWKNYSQARIDEVIERFGEDSVEIDSQSRVRLKWRGELADFEKPGEFILMPGEEITDGVSHANAINLAKQISPCGTGNNRQKMLRNMRALAEQEASSGAPMLGFVCHPNWRWALSAEDLAAIEGDPFFELYNGHADTNFLGDATRPGMERMWDIANHLRLTKMKKPPLMGIASDDTHFYDNPGSTADPGRGWVQVRSRELTPEALISAMRAGDFYSSTGVELEDIVYDPKGGRLELMIKAKPGHTYVTQFIGARRGADEAGIVLAEEEGLNPRYNFKGDELYVRAAASSSVKHSNPSFKEQHEQAWTQAVGWSVDTKANKKGET